MHRAGIIALGFVLAGLGGIDAYFLLVFETTTSSTAISRSLPNLNPLQPPTQPFTVLLLGSDDDAKFVPDRLTTHSMILLRLEPSTRQATMLSISPDGKTVAFLAPNASGGQFQLWTVGSAGPASVRAITSDLALEADSAPVWVVG